MYFSIIETLYPMYFEPGTFGFFVLFCFFLRKGSRIILTATDITLHTAAMVEHLTHESNHAIKINFLKTKTGIDLDSYNLTSWFTSVPLSY